MKSEKQRMFGKQLVDSQSCKAGHVSNKVAICALFFNPNPRRAKPPFLINVSLVLPLAGVPPHFSNTRISNCQSTAADTFCRLMESGRDHDGDNENRIHFYRMAGILLSHLF